MPATEPADKLAGRVWARLRKVFFWLSPEKRASAEQEPESERDHALVLSITQPKHVPHWRQLRYSGRVLNSSEKKILVTAIVLGVIFLISAVAILINQDTISMPASGGTYTEALVGEPQALNPIDAPANDADADISSLIYSGLFKMQGMEAMPDLAESFGWSPDSKILTVKIRKDAKFHNGLPVTADDVQFTIESIQDPARGSLLEPVFRGISVGILDPQTIQFTLPRADATFLVALTVGIVPSSLWEDIPANTARLANLNLKPIGSGPYLVKSFTRDQKGLIRSFTLEAWPDFYGVKPHIKTITFQFYPDSQTAEDAIKSDLVDGLAFVSPTEIDRFKSTARWNSVTLELPQQTIAFFNLKDKLLSDIRVRQALALAISRQDIINALGGHGVADNSAYPFLPATNQTASSTDLENARKLLQTAGWVLPKDSNVRVYEKPSATTKATKDVAKPTTTDQQKLLISITVSDQTDLLKIADVLKRQWSLLGAQVEIMPLDQVSLLRKANHDRNGQVILSNILVGADQDLFPIWWSGQAGERGMNFSALAEKDVDILIDLTKSSTSTAMLQKSREKLSATILKYAPAAFLIRPLYSYVISTKVKGLPQGEVLARPSDRFQNIEDWYIKTGLRWK
ncbi:MAG: ABC transporter substrate-binding protein [Patescibacteria group bacterium]|jgi:peptide/nickel transport system substrate-binding protein